MTKLEMFLFFDIDLDLDFEEELKIIRGRYE